MKILFLDDDDLRHELFAEWMEGHEVVHAHSIGEFLAALGNHTFDEVWLDHDLNDFALQYQSVDPTDNRRLTGNDACHILAAVATYKPKVVIHSWNNLGAENMLGSLKCHGFSDIVVKDFDTAKYFERLKRWEKEKRNHPYIAYFLSPRTP